MNVKKSDAIAFLKGLGFSKAVEWEDDKIVGRLTQVPGHVKVEDIPKEHIEFYETLGKAEGEIKLVDDGEKKKGEDALEPKQRKTAVDRAVDKAAKTKKDEDMKKNKKDAKEAKKGGKEKPAKEKKAKKAKVEVKLDDYGAKEGSIRAKVNKHFPKDWKSIEEIAEAADVKPRQARIRLRRAVKNKVLEVRRRIEYRLVAKKKD